MAVCHVTDADVGAVATSGSMCILKQYDLM